MKKKPVSLSFDARNVNKHDDTSLAAVRRSVDRLGAGRSIVADASGTLIAGEATLRAAQDLGIPVRTVETDGSELLCVIRKDMTPDDPRRRALALADNQTAKLSFFDDDKLVSELQTLGDHKDLLEAVGLPENELLDLLTPPDDSDPADAEPQTDRAAELREQWGTAPGQLWLLGKHRLLCGDSTKPEDVARVLDGCKPLLMVTDPPYGVEYDADWRTTARNGDGTLLSTGSGRARGAVSNDDRADWRDAWSLFPGDVAYAWHGERQCVGLAAQLRDSGFETRNLIAWAKSCLVIGRGHYHSQHETCWYAVRKGGTAHWTGDHSQTTLWQIDKPQKSETGHSTQKPLECMARPIRNHEAPEVYDPFLGSGTTIIAAENLGRRCYGLEISPEYCAVILQRYRDAFPDQEIRLGSA